MRQILSYIFVGICATLTAISGAAAEPQQAAGSRVAMTVPAGFTPASAYSGFENAALSASFVILEIPGAAYDQIKAGFNAEALATKGIGNVELKSLQRPDEHLYVTGMQDSPIGKITKFMLVIRDGDVAALVSGNIPEKAISSGKLTVAAVETALAGARIATKAAPEKVLFTLGDLGVFKAAGTLAGTARAFTLDGVLSPPPGAPKIGRELFLVAPSLDARPVGDLEAFTRKALPSLAGVTEVKVGPMKPVTISGLTGLATSATGQDDGVGKPLHIYHVVLVNPAGGYYRIVGMTYEADPKPRIAEFERMAQSFQLAK